MGGESNLAAARELVEILRVGTVDPERPYSMSADREPEYRRTITPRLDPEIAIDVTAMRMPAGMRQRYDGIEGWWEFWLGWLEEWDDYRFSAERWEARGDEVIFEIDIAARGRASGVPVAARITHVWSFREGRLRRLRLFPSRRRAIAALEREAGE